MRLLFARTQNGRGQKAERSGEWPRNLAAQYPHTHHFNYFASFRAIVPAIAVHPREKNAFFTFQGGRQDSGEQWVNQWRGAIRASSRPFRPRCRWYIRAKIAIKGSRMDGKGNSQVSLLSVIAKFRSIELSLVYAIDVGWALLIITLEKGYSCFSCRGWSSSHGTTEERCDSIWRKCRMIFFFF